LAVFRPWSQSDHSIAANGYGGAAAIFVLAVMPRHTRLIYAVGIAIAVALVVLLVGPVVFGVQA
jgi:hypothetical protein